MSESKTRVKFTALIYKVGINPVVDVPDKISKTLVKEQGKAGYIPVCGTVNGVPYRQTLMPRGKRGYCLFVNTEMRKGAKAGVGDKVTITIKIDSKPRIVPMPKLLADVLKKNKKAKAGWNKNTPSHQKQALLYLNSLKKEESLKRRIAIFVKQLEELAIK